MVDAIGFEPTTPTMSRTRLFQEADNIKPSVVIQRFLGHSVSILYRKFLCQISDLIAI